MSNISNFLNTAKNFASNVASDLKEVVGDTANSLANGAKVAGHTISNIFNIDQQDVTFAKARVKADEVTQKGLEKARAGLEKAENKLKFNVGSLVMNKPINVVPLAQTLEAAKLKASSNDSKVKATMKKSFNALASYHQAVAIKGEEASRTVAKTVYSGVKGLLFMATLTLISDCKVGRVIQEGVALTLAAVARVATMLVAATLFILPELAIVGGLAAAGVAGTGALAGVIAGAGTVTTLKTAGIALAVLAGAGYIVRNEILHAATKKDLQQIIAVLTKEKNETEDKEVKENFKKVLSEVKERNNNNNITEDTSSHNILGTFVSMFA